jgi:hypothetical protein
MLEVCQIGSPVPFRYVVTCCTSITKVLLSFRFTYLECWLRWGICCKLRSDSPWFLFAVLPSSTYLFTVGVEGFYFHLITLKHTSQSVGLLWTRDRPVAETSTWQHKHCTRDKHPCPRWDSNPRSQQALGRRPCGHWDRPPWFDHPNNSWRRINLEINFTTLFSPCIFIELFAKEYQQ